MLHCTWHVRLGRGETRLGCEGDAGVLLGSASNLTLEPPKDLGALLANGSYRHVRCPGFVYGVGQSGGPKGVGTLHFYPGVQSLPCSESGLHWGKSLCPGVGTP